MGVTFINLFQVADGRDTEFLALWQRVNDYLRAKPGYVEEKLHRAVLPDARYRYANIAIWASQEAWQAAHDSGFRTLLADPAFAEFEPLPTLYELVRADSSTEFARP